MTSCAILFKRLVATVTAGTVALGVAQAQANDVDTLLERLREPDLRNWEAVEKEIWTEWSKSGSPSMDLLLQRGRDAMEEGDTQGAIEHFTALTDHAPGFAEGWNARATAFFQAERYGPALADIEHALALNPRHFGAITGLGRILEELGFVDDALSAYRAAAAIHPHRPDVQKALDRLERDRGGRTL